MGSQAYGLAYPLLEITIIRAKIAGLLKVFLRADK